VGRPLLGDFTARQLAHAFRSLGDDDLHGNGVAMSLLADAVTAYRRVWPAIDAAGSQFTRACHQYKVACRPPELAWRPVRRRRRWPIAWLTARTPTPPPPPPSPDEAWAAVVAAGVGLAAVLDPLGDHLFVRCQRAAEWGTCGLAILDEDGVCRSSLGHLDGDA
jgi:hypothetical protein